MPADLIASVVAPKIAMAFSLADAHGAEDASFGDTASHQIAATSFIQLPFPRSRLLKMLVGPEISAYHWLQDKFGGLWHKMFDGHVSPDQARMVEYYAASCGHCKHLEPVWKEAAAQWASDPESAKIVWQQKQCLDDNWKPGADYKECQEQHILGFPTVNFFPPGSKTGDDFFFERTPEKLVEFAKTGIHPNPSVIPAGEGGMADVKLVDYYSAACPHCKSLDPVWTDTEKKWDADFAEREDAPVVSFEKRECYDDHWKPGKDFMECKRLGIHSFPNIKFLTPAEDGHGFIAQTDYSGARTSEDMINFLKKQADMEEPPPLDTAAQHQDESASLAKAASLQQGLPASSDHNKLEGELRDEPVLAAPIVGRATIKVAPAEAAPVSDTKAEAGKGPFGDVADVVKTAMVPLPFASLSCLPVRRSLPKKGSERSLALAAPATPAQFL